MTEKIVSSTRQLNIYETWKDTDYNILINAVAGSGKTTVLLNLLEYCKGKTLLLTFNKSIQEEVQEKIDNRKLRQGKAMTAHSLGLQAINKKYYRVTVNKNKNFDIVKKVLSIKSKLLGKISWQERLGLTYTLMDMNDISRLYLTNDMKEISMQMFEMDKTLSNNKYLKELWETLLFIRKEYYRNTDIEIDFIDMIYLPVINNLHIPVDPMYLMIDEAQDLNICQHKMIDLLIAQGDVKKWIAVGDKNQSIYAFSGAHSTSFDLFLDKGNVKELPLDICYRCAETIVQSANGVYPVMRFPHFAEKGVVEVIKSVKQVKAPSMVICRNLNPLIAIYFKLLGLGKNCHIKGEEILKPLIKFLNPYKSYSISTAKNKMKLRLLKLEKDETDTGRMQAYVFKENFTNFLLLATNLLEIFSTVETLIKKTETLFVNKGDSITLCTIHKAKGLEADIVYILNESLIPNKFAKSEEQLKQEENLRYVARTRAKKELYFLEL